MQRLLWPLRIKRTERLVEGHNIYATGPHPDGEIQAVITKRRMPNGKREWNVYTRYLIYDDDGNEWWEYRDGLEFRHFENLASYEFNRRSDELRWAANE